MTNRFAVILTSFFVNGKIWTAVTKSGMSVHDSILLMAMHMPGISSSPFILWLCLDSQTIMNRCGPGVCGTLMFYWFIYSSIL